MQDKLPSNRHTIQQSTRDDPNSQERECNYLPGNASQQRSSLKKKSTKRLFFSVMVINTTLMNMLVKKSHKMLIS